MAGDCSTGSGRRLLYRKWKEIALPEMAGDCSTGSGRRLLYRKWKEIGPIQVAGQYPIGSDRRLNHRQADRLLIMREVNSGERLLIVRGY